MGQNAPNFYLHKYFEEMLNNQLYSIVLISYFYQLVGELMQNKKKWLYSKIPIKSVSQLTKNLRISSLLAKAIISKGFEDTFDIQKFLNPSIKNLHDPFFLDGIELAAKRIISAINNDEKILIYGDYDVDGITSTSILYRFITSQKGDVDFYIPDRVDEGYGLSNTAIEKIILNKPALIVTVDCGITSISEVDFLNRNNIDVIITDHHECQEILPNAYAVVNPCCKGTKYPFKYIAGVGVTYKLICVLCDKNGATRFTLRISRYCSFRYNC